MLLGTMSPPCNLQYPERFHAAVHFHDAPAFATHTAISDETKLLLYALRQQASSGPCKEPRPSRWNFVESAMWQSWVALGQMSNFEAMHHYVRTLEQACPKWWDIIAADYEQHKLPSEHLLSHAISTAKRLDKPSIAKSRSDPTHLQPTQAPSNGTTPALAPTTPAPSLSSPRPPSQSDPAVPIPDQATTVNVWAQLKLPAGVRGPAQRYEHASAIVASNLYILSGTGSGSRYLHDTWILDLLTLTWSNPRSAPPPPPASTPTDPTSPPPPPSRFLPPCSGHTAVPYHDSLLVLGGRVHRKYVTDHLQLWQLNPLTLSYTPIPTVGPIPKALASHTSTIIKDCLYIFGGEDQSRRPVSDLHILNLTTMTWIESPNPSGPTPPPRSAHTATAFLDRYIMVYGGGAGALCHSDVWALDTSTLTWQQLEVAGEKLAPRAGHAAALVGDAWYVVGGGNNMRGCTDMVVLQLGGFREQLEASKEGGGGGKSGWEGGKGGQKGLVRWETLCSMPQHSPLASEGLSLGVVRRGGAHFLLAFGGYNGDYHNMLNVMRVDAAVGGGGGHSAAELEAAQKEAAAAKQEAAVAKDTGTLLHRQVLALQQELQQAEEKLAGSQQLLAASQQRCAELDGKVVALQQLVQELEAAVAAAVAAGGAAGGGAGSTEGGVLGRQGGGKGVQGGDDGKEGEGVGGGKQSNEGKPAATGLWAYLTT